MIYVYHVYAKLHNLNDTLDRIEYSNVLSVDFKITNSESFEKFINIIKDNVIELTGINVKRYIIIKNLTLLHKEGLQ